MPDSRWTTGCWSTNGCEAATLRSWRRATSPGSPTVDDRIRIEHWVVAERQGQVAADVILGDDTSYSDAPFFWSVHFDVRIRFVGYAGGHEERTIVGDLRSDGAVFYRRGGEHRGGGDRGKGPPFPRSRSRPRAGRPGLTGAHGCRLTGPRKVPFPIPAGAVGPIYAHRAGPTGPSSPRYSQPASRARKLSSLQRLDTIDVITPMGVRWWSQTTTSCGSLPPSHNMLWSSPPGRIILGSPGHIPACCFRRWGRVA